MELAEAGAKFGAPIIGPKVRGGDAVARVFNGRAQATRLVHVNGAPAAAYLADGIPRAIYLFRFTHGRVASVDVLAEEEILAALDIVV